jgi:hypothetical protein
LFLIFLRRHVEVEGQGKKGIFEWPWYPLHQAQLDI